MKYACISNERFKIEVSSESRDDVSYEVSIQDIYRPSTNKLTREWRCSCPGWILHHVKKPSYECKHIRQVRTEHWCGWRQSQHGQKAVLKEETDNTDTDFLCPNCGNLAYPENTLKVRN